MKVLVDDRNELIHYLLPRYTLDSIDCCLEVEQYLDQQGDRHIPESEHLKSVIERLEKNRLNILFFIATKDWNDRLGLTLGQKDTHLLPLGLSL